MELIKAPFIDEGHQRLGGSFQHTRAPEGRCGRGAFSGHAVAALRGIGQIHRGEAAGICRAKGAFFVAHLAGTLGLQRGQIIIKAIAHHLIHQVQAIKSIPRIGNTAGSIGTHAIIFHVIAGQCRTAQQHGNIHALARHFFQVFAHDDGGFHQQTRHADGMRLMFARSIYNFNQRHFDAQIDHAIAVIGQDDIHQILADIMHITLHRAEHDGALFLAFDTFHIGFEIGNGGLHGFRRLQHEGKLHLAGAEKLPHHLHAIQQNIIDDGKRRDALGQSIGQFIIQPLAVAINNAVLQAAFNRLSALLRRGIGGFASAEKLQHLLQRIIIFRAAIIDQILRNLHFLRRDLMQRLDLGDMHNRARHARLHGEVQKHTVQYMPRGGVEPEGDIGKPQDDLNLRKLIPDHANALKRPKAKLAVILITGRDREGQRVNHQIRLRQPVLVAGKFHQAARDAQLILGGFRHAHFINGQRNHRRAEFARQDHTIFGGFLAFFEVDRIDDGLAAMQLECRFNHRGFGGINHQRAIHAAGEAANHLGHFRHFIAPDKGSADVQAI